MKLAYVACLACGFAACAASSATRPLGPELAQLEASDDARAMARSAPGTYAEFARAAEAARTASATEVRDRTALAQLVFARGREETRVVEARARLGALDRAQRARDEIAHRESAHRDAEAREARAHAMDEARRAALARVLSQPVPRAGDARGEAALSLIDAASVSLATAMLLDVDPTARAQLDRAVASARTSHDRHDAEGGYTLARRAYDLGESLLAPHATTAATTPAAVAPPTTVPTATVAVLRGLFVARGTEFARGGEARVATVATRLVHADREVVVEVDADRGVGEAIARERGERVRAVLVAHGLVEARVQVETRVAEDRDGEGVVRLGVKERTP